MIHLLEYAEYLVILLGLIIGSLINCIAYRLPLMLEQQWHIQASQVLEVDSHFEEQEQPLNLFFPRSHCPHCSHSLHPLLLIPVISYIATLGKCWYCKKAISITYPLIEIITALIFWHIFYEFGSQHFIQFMVYAAVSSAMLLLFLIDAKKMILPDTIVLPLIWGGLLYQYYLNNNAFESAFLGCIVGYISFYAIRVCASFIMQKEALGMGDVKLFAAIGVWCGVESLILIVFIASVLGLAMNLILISVQKRRINQEFPFGPFLLVPAWIAMIYGPYWIFGSNTQYIFTLLQL